MDNDNIHGEEIFLLSSDNQKVGFNKKLIEFSPVIEMASQDEIIPTIYVSGFTLNMIKKFLEDHNYDKSQIWVRCPLITCFLDDNVDKKSYELFKQYEPKTKKNLEILKQLIQESDILNIELFRNVCEATLVIRYYIGPTKFQLEDYLKKNKMTLSDQERQSLIQEFEPIYEKFQAMWYGQQNNQLSPKKQQIQDDLQNYQLDDDEPVQQNYFQQNNMEEVD